MLDVFKIDDGDGKPVITIVLDDHTSWQILKDITMLNETVPTKLLHGKERKYNREDVTTLLTQIRKGLLLHRIVKRS